MTFPKTILIFFIFLLLISCKGYKYFNSTINPAGVSVILQNPSVYYSNVERQDSLSFLLVNNNSETIIIPQWWNNLLLIGESRFYKKEITIHPQPNDLKTNELLILPHDTVLLIKIPICSLLSKEKNWLYHSKNVLAPHFINAKKTHPYIYFSAEFNIKIPMQDEIIKVRSSKSIVNILKFEENTLKNKKTELSIATDVLSYNIDSKKGNLLCKINNVSNSPITLLNNSQLIDFKLYAYSPNRTAIMNSQFVLNNGKLPIEPIVIGSKENKMITIPIHQLLFTDLPEIPFYYWNWNKNTPPISPILYGNKELATEVELWFGILINGKEYFSNTIKINITKNNKKSSQKNE